MQRILFLSFSLLAFVGCDPKEVDDSGTGGRTNTITSDDTDTTPTDDTGTTGGTDDTGTDDTGTGTDDMDGDGFGADDDCDDNNADINPDADEVCDGADNDCDGTTDVNASDAGIWFGDGDEDGYGDEADKVTACDQPEGYSEYSGDCDDADAAYNPGATEDDCADPNDYNCDGAVGYTDGDGDGFAACEECDDGNDAIYPGADEYCDLVDNNCDGTVDEDSAVDAPTWSLDSDSDGYGAEDGDTITSCSGPANYANNADDCDDSNEDINPGEDEVCDSIDNDCNGSTDGADAIDLETYYADGDEDGYGDFSDSTDACSAPSGYTDEAGDCDDTDASINPDGEELCDLTDNDCDSSVDEGATDATYLAVDLDGDGFGDPGTTDLRCGGVENEWDCDDSNGSEPQVVDALSGAAGPDGSLVAPWRSIQDGIDNANQCVRVLPATYFEDIDFDGNDVEVIGIGGAGDTIIAGTGSNAVVTFAAGESSGAALSGFTLRTGGGYQEVAETSYSCGSGETCTDYLTTYCGGGLYIDGATPTLSNLLVLDNSLVTIPDYVDGNDSYYYYSYGGGACLRNTVVDLSAVDFWNNYADEGGALYVESTATVDLSKSYVINNTAENGGAIQVDGGSVNLSNVLAAWNTADEGGGVLAIDGALTATNVTFGANDAGVGGNLYASGSSTATVMNSIVYGAATGEGVLVDSGGSFSGTYNNVYGNAGGEYSGATDPTGVNGNISENPLFASVSDDDDATNDDWTLGASSPSIDAGNPSAAMDDPDGTTNDQGAWGGPDAIW